MRLLTVFWLLIVSPALFANVTQLSAIEFTQENDVSRIIVQLSERVMPKIFMLKQPDRLVIDLKNTALTTQISTPSSHPLISNIRSAPRNQQDLRVVFDLTAQVKMKSFSIPAQQGSGYWLIIDIFKLHSNQSTTRQKEKSPPPPQPASDNKDKKRKITIAIDAGHGGIDPGAIGKNGTYEKNVVLAIARRLAKLINQEPTMQAVMTRTDDYYLKLRRRIEIARTYQADLFISIHADALPDGQKAYGSSVYMLSSNGASSEAAQWLAHKENAADLMGGISLNDKDEILASVLLDLSQISILDASNRVADSILKSLGKVSHIHFSKVQYAAFMVLRAPDMPSVLVETAFISTPSEEQRLKNAFYQQQLAQAILNGIKNYFQRHPPPDMLVVKQ